MTALEYKTQLTFLRKVFPAIHFSRIEPNWLQKCNLNIEHTDDPLKLHRLSAGPSPMPVVLTVPKIKSILSPVRIPVGAPFESSSVGTVVLLDANTTVAFFINVSNKCSKIDGKGKLRIRRNVGWRREWFGKELQWKIETEPAVAFRQFITSRHLEVVSDRGLQA